MNTLDALSTAIQTRQAERMDQGEPAMTEMWLAPEMYDRLMEETAYALARYDGVVSGAAFAGVIIRRLGDDP